MIVARPDLLIVGGLTLDRLGDGSVHPGGSVLHAARAVAASGRRVATITAAGPEPEVVPAVAELAALGPSRAARLPSSIRYAIHEAGRGRRLVLESAGGAVTVTTAEMVSLDARAVLLAPIAGELGAGAVRASSMLLVRVGGLQGWLRHLARGEEARALPLAALAAELTSALGELDALVASDEDLAAVAARPRAQLAALRAHVGPRPALLVTQGAGGAWLDDPATGIRHLPAARRLGRVPTIGAGDAFAALLAVGLGSGLVPLVAAIAAMAATADALAARR